LGESGYVSSVPPRQFDFLSPADETLRKKLRVPTTLLCLSAVLDFIALVLLVVSGAHEAMEHGPISDAISPLVILVLAIKTSLCFVIGAGAMAVRNLRNYRLGKAASYLAMVPFSPSVLLGLPAGLWTLRILNRADVIDVFQRRAAKSGESERPPAMLLIPTVAITVLALMMVIWSYIYQVRSRNMQTATISPTQAVPNVFTSPIPPDSYHFLAMYDGKYEFGPALTEPIELQPDQVEALNRLLNETYQQYLVIEGTHTRKSSDRPGRVVVTIEPFSAEMEGLENEFWTKADAIMRDDVQRRSARERIRPLLRGSVFQFHAGMNAEMWRSGSFYAWKYSRNINTGDYRGPFTASTSEETEDARLPEELQRFWD
jgi:hypothetical protein